MKISPKDSVIFPKNKQENKCWEYDDGYVLW